MNIIPLHKPSLSKNDIKAAVKVLESGMLVMGKKTLEFEKLASKYIGTGLTQSVALNNGTSTMLLALKALGIKQGDEVIVPAFSYIATANVVELLGAKPVFVDIDINTFNIDASKIESKITDKTKAIIPVHEFGLPCDISTVCEIATKYKLFVIEDAACALGSKFNNQHVGTFGDAGSFSFHPRKNITSGEGGLVTTKNNVLAKKVRQLLNHGLDPNAIGLNFVEAGFNCRITDFQSAMLLSQMERIEQILKIKKQKADYYLNNLSNSKIKLPYVPKARIHSWQTFYIVLQKDLSQKEIIVYFRKEGIATNYGAQCIPDQHYYKKKYQLNVEKLFPNALRAYSKGLVLPLYESLTQKEQEHIIKTVNSL
jgi:perosamine synthetase